MQKATYSIQKLTKSWSHLPKKANIMCVTFRREQCKHIKWKCGGHILANNAPSMMVLMKFEFQWKLEMRIYIGWPNFISNYTQQTIAITFHLYMKNYTGRKHLAEQIVEIGHPNLLPLHISEAEFSNIHIYFLVMMSFICDNNGKWKKRQTT